MKAWYLIYSKSRKEQIAIDNLKLKGYEVYLPMVPVKKCKKSECRYTLSVMFPQYFFIHLCDETDDWESIGLTVGVANIVRFTQKPIRVADKLITFLKNYELIESIKRKSTTELKSELTTGDKVRILNDNIHFGGLEAIIKTKCSKDRVILLLHYATNNHKINIHQSQLEALT